MATSKRRRNPAETDEESEHEDVTPPPRRHSTSKRARTNSDDNNADEQDWRALEDASTQRAAIAIKKKMSEVVENVPADHGIILAVICENFMCHKFLEIKFGPFINFVIGHNGSGKSAILTAITLALGGKAASTNRGNAMKSFIKEGEEQARITIKLKNGGEGFKRDQYDDVIIVERNFSREGSSGYKLKSKQGKIISSKRDELDEICDWFGLQVDNPMNVLTQDLARAFLSTSTNQDKYKFFARGVQLEQLDQDYSLIKNGIDSTEAILETKVGDITELKATMDQWAEKQRQLESHDTLRDRIQTMSHQMAWAQSKVTRAEEEREQASSQFENANHVHEELIKQVRIEEEKLTPLEEAKDAAKAQMDHIKKELQTLIGSERETRSNVLGATKKITETEQEIMDEENRLEGVNGGSNIQLMEDQRSAENDVIRIKADMESHDQKNKDDNTKLQEAKQEFDQAIKLVQAKKAEIASKQTALKQISAAEGDFIKVFGAKLRPLLDAIQSERSFRVKPVGPVGMYVTLREPKWWSIIERILGNNLLTFVVTCYEDSEILKRLMKSINCQYPLSITQVKPLNLVEPDPRFKTIYRILEISDENVKRQLVIGNSIEQVILVEDLEDANRIMERRTQNDHINSCYALNLNRQGWGLKVGGNNGASGVTPVNAFTSQARMRTDVGAQTKFIEQDIQRLKNELADLEQSAHDKKRVSDGLNSDIQNYNRRKRDFELKLHRAEDKIEECKSRLEEAAQDGKLGALQEKLKVFKERERMATASFEELVVKKDEFSAEGDKLYAQLKSTEQDLALAQQQVEDLKAMLYKSDRKRSQCLANKNHWYEQLEKYQQETARLEDQIATQQATVDNYTGMASRICERVEIPNDETCDALERKLAALHEELKRAEASLGGTAEYIHAKSAEAAQTYIDARDQRNEFQRLLGTQTRVYMERIRRWKEFQRYISARARAQFNWMMSERAFKGRLRLEHTRKPPELILEVQPGQEETGNRGPKTLSGGEKSFSTICLLLSLWEAMGSPIRCLDEFDVFMDAVNRTISVNMMIKAAERSIGKQFILITPQAMNSTAASNQVKIIRMADPERNNNNQTRIA
ncbi:uncharacterized protein LAJ45_06292 [Morchella importuna]|uniref:uncharacterized protein n=1 Tax=Morchella importuna TaxID=1174673 RepID=UPI001E8D4405|nr:uncharacterized protein LAJ45_06292 [Morchella importuna]KAH8149661.1 hypothetical protein LAJ45_06292 [Morchella importuna]